MGLQNHIERALREDGFDLEHLGFEFVPDKFDTFFNINTTDKETIEAIVSCLFSEVLTHGVTVERFSGCEHTMILIDPTVRKGVIEEMNAHELEPSDAPLDSTPTFYMSISGPVHVDEADFATWINHNIPE